MEEQGGASAYGAALAGGGVDFRKFVRQPQTIVRVLSWLFAMVVFSCITNEGYVNSSTSPDAKCIFNQNDSACHYAVGIGVLAFLACLIFLVLDVSMQSMSNVQQRKLAVMTDMCFSAAWTFLWFVCFCLLASQWAHTTDDTAYPKDAARAAIAFSFFSIATWGILAYFAFDRFRHGLNDVTTSTYSEQPQDLHTPYPATYAPTSYNPTTYTPTTYTYPSNMPEVQQSPFTSSFQPQGDYKPPNY